MGRFSLNFTFNFCAIIEIILSIIAIFIKLSEEKNSVEFENLVAQNPWWKKAGWESDDKHLRQLEKYKYVYHRKNFLPEKNGIVLVYGPRQVGKTTWIKQHISEKLSGKISTSIFYMDAEMIRDRFELYDAIKTILRLYDPTHIYVDEISAVPEWERTAKALEDEGVFEKKQVVFTGSSSTNIMKKAERLPGRMATGQNKFRYYPLSFKEIAALYGIIAKTPKEALASLDKLNRVLYLYFLHGGFIRALNRLPDGVLDEEIFSIYAAWIDGEVAKARRSPETATRVLDGIANAMTNEVSWNGLAKGISHPTIAEYAELLRDMFVIDYIEPSKRANVGAPKNKKIYFADPFLYWVALFKSRKIDRVGISDLDSTTVGKIAELSAYANIKQHIDFKTKENDFDPRRYVHFEKERNGEIDFVVRYGKKSWKIECKFGRIDKEKEGVVYLTKDVFDRNKIPLAVFLMFPEASLELLKM